MQKRMNVEHRTSNVEHRMWMMPFGLEMHVPSLISEAPGIRIMLEDSPSMVEISLKIDRMPYSTFDVGRSMFDVRVFEVSNERSAVRGRLAGRSSKPRWRRGKPDQPGFA